MTLEEKRSQKATYMRDYWKRNPEKYQKMIARQKENKNSTKRYHRIKYTEEYKEQKTVADKKYYANNKRKIRLAQGAKTYGISVPEYEYRRSLPCMICGERKPEGKRGSGMHVDHCHKTNKLRGTLCDTCNRGLGSFKDDPYLLSRASRYLTEWRREDEGSDISV